MRIIIEGADGVGKSTITKEIAEEYNLSLVHLTNRDPRDFEFYKESLRKQNVIYDRNFISEMIYPEIFNRPGKLEYYEFDYLINKAKDLGYQIFIIHNNDYKLKNFEEEVIKDNILKIKEDYLKLGAKYNIPIVKNKEEIWKKLKLNF